LLPAGFESALAGAAPATAAPTTIAALTSILAIVIAVSPVQHARAVLTQVCGTDQSATAGTAGRRAIRSRTRIAKPAPALAIIGGSSKKHTSCHANPVSRTPTSSSAALRASVPINWTAYLVDEAVVVFMDPDSRPKRLMSSVLTPVFEAQLP
jgi:hypothetical protein